MSVPIQMSIETVNARWPDTDEGRQKKLLLLVEMMIREQNETNRLLREEWLKDTA